MNYFPIDFCDKFKLINDYWSPKIIGRMNNYLIKLVKVKGEFVWHKHDETDEVFIIHKGNLRIDFRDGNISLNEGQMYIIPKGKEHKPFSENECEMIVIEQDTTINTGDIRNELTKENLEWI